MSDEVVQALSNQVQTSVIGQPGLDVSIYPSKSVLTACEPFTYSVPWSNNAAGLVNTGSLIVTLPHEVQLLTGTTGLITHKRNTSAIASGASSTTGDLTNSPYLSTITTAS